MNKGKSLVKAVAGLLTRCLALTAAIVMTAVAALAGTQPAHSSAAVKKAAAVVEELGLMDTDKEIGQNESSKISRAQFAQILLNLSGNTDTISGVAVSVYPDVTKSCWAAGYIKKAVESGWMSAYLDGNFKPDQTVTLREAVYGILRAVGYEASDFSSGMAESVNSLYGKKKLGTGISLSMTDGLNRQACEQLLYNTLKMTNKTGSVVGAALGCTLDSSGEINYTALVSSKLDGPYVLTGSLSDAVPFSLDSAEFYRDGSKAAKNGIKTNDVIYYSESRRTVWAYSKKATGTVESISPSDLSPETVRISGTDYKLETASMQEEFSVFGSVGVGDVVTVLLGSDGSIAGIADTAETISGKTVLLLELSEKNKTTGAGSGVYMRFADASAAEYELPYTGETDDFTKGSLITITYADGKITSASYSGAGTSVSGRVSENGKSFGGYEFATDAVILDKKDTAYLKVYPSRLAGSEISSSYVQYCKLNEKGQISELILKDYTGDLHQYGMLLEITSSGQSYSVSYDINGTGGTLTSTGISGSIGSGVPSGFYFGEEETELTSLNGINVTALDGVTVSYGSGSTIRLADTYSVYLQEGTKYSLTDIDEVNPEDYYLTAYYDKTQDIGGRVRVIVAAKKA